MCYLPRFKEFHETDLKMCVPCGKGLRWVVYGKPTHYVLFQPACLFFCELLPPLVISEIICRITY